MTFALSGSIITQTGTDTSLAGLAGIAGVVATTRGDHTTYTLETLQLTISGTLSINPATEQLVFGNTPTDTAVYVNSGAILNVGTETVVNGESTFSEGLWLRVTRRGVVAWAIGGLRVNPGSTINWRGGDIDTAASPSFAGTCNIRRGSIYLRETLVQAARCLCAGGANLTNLTLYNNGFGPEGSFTGSFSNCKVVDGAVIGMHGVVVNLTITDYDYEARGSILTTAANSKWVSKNTVRGMAAQNGHNVQPARLLFTKDLSFTVRNPSGAAIPNVSIYSKEYLGTNRPVAGFIPGDDFTAPITSVISTNASGVATFSNWRLGLTYRNAINYYQSFWTKSGNNTDSQDFSLWGYGVLPQSLDVSLKGAGTRTTETALLPDTNVTLSESAAVAKLAAAFVVNSGSNTITVTSASTLDDLYDAMKAWGTRPIAEQLEYPTISTQPVAASGDTLSSAMMITGIEFLEEGAKFKKIQAANHIAGGAVSNLSVVGDVTQATPTNLSNVSITGTLVYNTGAVSTINLVDSQIGTVRNDGVGAVTITRDALSSITDYSDPEINYLDSSIVATNITSATVYQTESDRDAGVNAGATFTSTLDFKYGASLNGVVMSNTVYLRVLVGNITLLAELPLAIGVNTLDLGVQGQLSTITSKLDTLNENQDNVNSGVKKASLLIPHNSDNPYPSTLNPLVS
jgi:hypothetical protein